MFNFRLDSYRPGFHMGPMDDQPDRDTGEDAFAPPAGDAIAFYLGNNPYSSRPQTQSLPQLAGYQPTGASSVTGSDPLSALYRLYDPRVENTRSYVPPSYFAYFGTSLPDVDRPGGVSTDPREPIWNGSPVAGGPSSELPKLLSPWSIR